MYTPNGKDKFNYESIIDFVRTSYQKGYEVDINITIPDSAKLSEPREEPVEVPEADEAPDYETEADYQKEGLTFDELGWSEVIPFIPEIIENLSDNDIIRFSKDDPVGDLWINIKDTDYSHALAFQLHEVSAEPSEMPEGPQEVTKEVMRAIKAQTDFTIGQAVGLNNHDYFFVTNEDKDHTTKVFFLGRHPDEDSAFEMAYRVLPDEEGVVISYADAHRVIDCIHAFINGVITKH